MMRILTLLLCLLLTAPSFAAEDKTAIALTGKTWLGYIRTGDHETDRISEAGLRGLAAIVAARTSVETIDVMGVDPNRDDLAFFPLLYWPLTTRQAPLSPIGIEHVNDYLRHGGMVLFDTMTGEDALPATMKNTLAGIAIPPLVKLPTDHVLKRSFYLLDDFAGRYAKPEFWLNPQDAAQHDGVSTVLLGENAFAAAWAIDGNGNFMFPCIPDGERQREQAFRFGINLVMYALTGNYKSDQMHIDALMQKLGKPHE